MWIQAARTSKDSSDRINLFLVPAIVQVNGLIRILEADWLSYCQLAFQGKRQGGATKIVLYLQYRCKG